MKLLSEKRLLQITVLVGGIVPVTPGLLGSGIGLAFVDGLVTRDADSHFRYLSGLLLAIGFGFWSCVPDIETKTARFRLLTLIVFIGGLARLFGCLVEGVPSPQMQFGLMMELAVTPLLCWWQGRLPQQH
ncbi:MAG: DUF4345 domain-containing protein [Pseudomonadota bacterium]